MRTLTTKVDTYSFGIVIMELFMKQRPTGLKDEGGLPLTLRHLVERAMAEEKPLQVIDPDLTSSITRNEEDIVTEILNLALSCTSLSPEKRPDMNLVLSNLIKLETAVWCQNNDSNSFK